MSSPSDCSDFHAEIGEDQMDFLLDDTHTDLASSLDSMLTKADVASVSRAWADGDTSALTPVLESLADTGVCGLMIDEAHGGAGAGAVEMVVTMETIGYHGVPGPLVESFVVLPALLQAAGATDALTPITLGGLGTCAVPPHAPWAADTGPAEHLYVTQGTQLHAAVAGDARRSVDPTRTLAPLTAGEAVGGQVDPIAAADLGSLATASMLIGLGKRMLDTAAEYAQARKQFGRAIGSFQAVKHHLADVAIALEMSRPLVHAAAVGIDGNSPAGTDVGRDVSAAKVAAADAAYLSSRHALQVLGAIGYTAEHDLSLYLTKTRALVTAWGTPAAHRARILETL